MEDVYTHMEYDYTLYQRDGVRKSKIEKKKNAFISYLVWTKAWLAV